MHSPLRPIIVLLLIPALLVDPAWAAVPRCTPSLPTPNLTEQALTLPFAQAFRTAGRLTANLWRQEGSFSILRQNPAGKINLAILFTLTAAVVPVVVTLLAGVPDIDVQRPANLVDRFLSMAITIWYIDAIIETAVIARFSSPEQKPALHRVAWVSAWRVIPFAVLSLTLFGLLRSLEAAHWRYFLMGFITIAVMFYFPLFVLMSKTGRSIPPFNRRSENGFATLSLALALWIPAFLIHEWGHWAVHQFLISPPGGKIAWTLLRGEFQYEAMAIALNSRLAMSLRLLYSQVNSLVSLAGPLSIWVYSLGLAGIASVVRGKPALRKSLLLAGLAANIFELGYILFNIGKWVTGFDKRSPPDWINLWINNSHWLVGLAVAFSVLVPLSLAMRLILDEIRRPHNPGGNLPPTDSPSSNRTVTFRRLYQRAA